MPGRSLEGCEQAFTELTSLGLSTIIKGESESYEAQISQIRELASSCDALALSVYEPQYFESLIDELADAGIPVATFNVDVPTSKRLFYIGCNYIESGKLCGELVAKLTGRRPGKVAIVTKKQSISILEQRIVGFRTVVAHEPFLEIVGPIKLTESPSDDEAQISDLLAANPDNCWHLRCQPVSLRRRAGGRGPGRQGSVVLVGHDLNDEHCALIADGAVDAVVCQEPFYQGYYPVKILLDYVIDRIMPPTREVFTRLEIVMKENLKYYATSHQAFINRPAQMT